MYAVDTAIITQNKNLETSIVDLQNLLDQVSNWFAKCKLKLNPAKCKAKIFTLKRYTNRTEIKINNQTIIWNNNKDQVIK